MHVLGQVVEVQAQAIQRQFIGASGQLIANPQGSVDVGDLLVRRGEVQSLRLATHQRTDV